MHHLLRTDRNRLALATGWISSSKTLLVCSFIGGQSMPVAVIASISSHLRIDTHHEEDRRSQAYGIRAFTPTTGSRNSIRSGRKTCAAAAVCFADIWPEQSRAHHRHWLGLLVPAPLPPPFPRHGVEWKSDRVKERERERAQISYFP